MPNTLKLLCLLFIFISFRGQAQLLNDQASLKTIQNSLDKIYNYEFEEAETFIGQVEKKYPNHPVTHILDSFILFWKYMPIKDNPVKSKEYLQKLETCLNAVNQKYGKNSLDPEAVFYTMVARGYMAMIYNYKGEMLNAAGEGKKAYNAFIEGMKLINKNPEFYFTSGMYNYYVEVYPEEHPIVKPLLVFFKGGDKALGLKQVDTATRLGTITRAEACFYLAHLYLKYESRPEKAVPYTEKLVDLYPKNTIFRMKNIEGLLLAGKYDAASPDIAILKKVNTGFYPAAWRTFQGLLEEKGHKNDAAAQHEYLLAIKASYDDQYTKEYHAMAYAGLARIASRANNKAKAKEYYKKCLDKAEYRALIREAKAYK
ncbi:ABC transporter substrate-binding protein [Dyadobacter sandarakinus]|uniref:ABC transporter substrate-binding protein n=1 Tax=Dyadobacter sandarakinus TaxID=2747268 RepID=A0ABX7I7Z0_9BACT|nr:ABC transporter substrate-binding protein [Dyadobacter sandarakinus]QRR01958.1 ABC transporter substrate-binding protein [Dyadobacter sandarakinus]